MMRPVLMSAVAVAILSTWLGAGQARAERLRQPSASDLAPPPAEAVHSLPVVVQRPISYKRHLLGPKIKSCLPPVEMVLQVQDPCTCCLVEVPVCIPACCTDVPTMDCHRGLLGRHVVSYNWCCGYHVKVVFDRHGCVTVHYYGRA